MNLSIKHFFNQTTRFIKSNEFKYYLLIWLLIFAIDLLAIWFQQAHFFHELRLLLIIALLLCTLHDFENHFTSLGVLFLIPNILAHWTLSKFFPISEHVIWIILSSSLSILLIEGFQYIRSSSLNSEKIYRNLEKELMDEKANSLDTILHLSLLGGMRETNKAIAQAYNVLENNFGIKHGLIFLAQQSTNTLIPMYKNKKTTKDEISPILVTPSFWKKHTLDKDKGVMNVIASQSKLHTLKTIIPEAQIDAIIAIPLSTRGKFFGLLTVLKKQSNTQTLPETTLMLTFGQILAATLDNCNIHEHRSSMLDKANKKSTEIQNSFGKYVSSSVVEELIQQKSPSIGGKTMEVSVLMADLRGFTALSKKLPIETLVSLLNKWFEKSSQLILQSNGTIDKYMGDCIMVLFGAPTKKSDDALRCVYTGFRLHERFKEFHKEIEEIIGDYPLGLGISITTGKAIVGNFGSSNRMEYTAIGETVNLASRLEKLAKPGEIIVDSNTFNLVPQSKFSYEIEENIQIKGLGEQNIVRLTEVLKQVPQKLPS